MHKYYCVKCKKYHHRGKIYKNHIGYKREGRTNSEDDYPKEGIKVNINDLRPIAKRQLRRLCKKMKLSGNHELYKTEIIKLIRNEKRR